MRRVPPLYASPPAAATTEIVLFGAVPLELICVPMLTCKSAVVNRPSTFQFAISYWDKGLRLFVLGGIGRQYRSSMSARYSPRFRYFLPYLHDDNNQRI